VKTWLRRLPRGAGILPRLHALLAAATEPPPNVLVGHRLRVRGRIAPGAGPPVPRGAAAAIRGKEGGARPALDVAGARAVPDLRARARDPADGVLVAEVSRGRPGRVAVDRRDVGAGRLDRCRLGVARWWC